MEIHEYVKRPVSVKAVLVTPNNVEDIARWVNENGSRAEVAKSGLIVDTPDGRMLATFNEHYVLQGLHGKFYVAVKTVFEERYDKVKKGGGAKRGTAPNRKS